MEGDEQGPPGKARLLAFSDGVFAIAITLLVLDLDVPEGLAPQELPAALAEQRPNLLSALLSFLVIGRFWIAHHGLYQQVRVVDGTQLVLGTALLAPIVFIPFVTRILADYGDTTFAVVGYSAVVATAALAEAVVLAHGTRRSVLGGSRPEPVRQKLTGTLLSGVGFLVAIPVAFASPGWAKLCWFLSVVPVGWLVRPRPREPR